MTIVVLLILAGITINLILGQNSIFNSANEAKNRTGISAFEEKLGMAYTDAMLERGVNGGLTPDKYFEILKKHGIISDVTEGGENIVLTNTNTDNKNVTWSSGDSTIATMSQTGEVTGVAVGETTITVTAEDAGGIKKNN